ncbi:hypothetical protein O3M35_009880 [Rhynocoris fuscipes]|uniref:Uncharacterized protein n=1 Tax=Rhynocoris fuscipes TaxID=488301 RepID=A0AAW1D5A8_9HEMI
MKIRPYCWVSLESSQRVLFNAIKKKKFPPCLSREGSRATTKCTLWIQRDHQDTQILSLSTITATWLMCSSPLSVTRRMTKTKPRRFPSKSAIYMRSAPGTSRKNSEMGLEGGDTRCGVCGTIPQATYNFLLGLGADALLAEEILIDSLGILSHHIYS